MNGKFIVLEGGDGCGKSTQLELLMARLEQAGRKAIATRQPGGTALGDALRKVLLDYDGELDAHAEALLFAADRAQHASEFICPQLEQGFDVVCDRFVASSIVYQGIGRHLGEEWIEQLNRWATVDLIPDLTLVIDVDAGEALRRREARRDRNRFENETPEYHESVLEAYRKLAAKNNWPIVDGNQSPDHVFAIIWSHVSETVFESGRSDTRRVAG